MHGSLGVQSSFLAVIVALMIVPTVLSGCSSGGYGENGSDASTESDVRAERTNDASDDEGYAAASGQMEGSIGVSGQSEENVNDGNDSGGLLSISSKIQGKWYSSASSATVEVMNIGEDTLTISTYTIQRDGSNYQWAASDRDRLEQRYEVLAPAQDLLERCTSDQSIWEHAVAILSVEYVNPTGATYKAPRAILDDGRITSYWMSADQGPGQRGGAWHRNWEDAANDPHLLKNEPYRTIFDDGYVAPPE